MKMLGELTFKETEEYKNITKIHKKTVVKLWSMVEPKQEEFQQWKKDKVHVLIRLILFQCCLILYGISHIF